MANISAKASDGIGRIRFEKPAVLNALDLEMFETLGDVLTQWRSDRSVDAVVVRGSGRAFSAGGDIRRVRTAAQSGDQASNDRLYRVEYSVNALIAAFGKPYVAVIDGICMGGGMGVSMHGSHRIVTDQALLAMPETAIAFFPDVGASYVFSRFAGALGMYLGLTGTRMNAGDALYCGVATHYAGKSSLEALAGLEDVLARRPRGEAFDTAFATFAEPHPASDLERQRAAIDRCFEAPDVRTIVKNLAHEIAAGSTAWATGALERLRAGSPTAIALTFALFREARHLDLTTCLRLEYLLAKQAWRRPEFLEGIRAIVVDKDRRPAWNPARIEDVDTDEIEALVAGATAAVARDDDAAYGVTADLFLNRH